MSLETHVQGAELAAAHLTWYAAEELVRGLEPQPRYTLLAKYPDWQPLLNGLRPFTDNWQPMLLHQAYAHGLRYGRALHAALLERQRDVDAMVFSLPHP